jgi:UDP-3-O-[3-hydroxymyristoyl] glucosamine N-acyltransferase
MISADDLRAASGADVEPGFEVDGLDLVGGSSAPRILSFLDDPTFVNDAKHNPNLSVVLVRPELESAFEDSAVRAIVVDDPRWHYYALHNHLAQAESALQASEIASDAQIDESASVAARGVRIGSGVRIEANAIIHARVAIGADSVIRSGAVIGTMGFEHKRTTRGILSVEHDGGVIIGERVEIGSQCTVARGFVGRDTVIGDDTKIDCLSHIAHCNRVGARVFVAAGVTISGSTIIEDDTWIGPGAVLRDQVRVGAGARVGIGSVVLRDVEAGAKVLGNPARAHA